MLFYDLGYLLLGQFCNSVFIVEKCCKKEVLIFCGFTYSSIFDAITVCLLNVHSLSSLGGKQKEKTMKIIMRNLYV